MGWLYELKPGDVVKFRCRGGIYKGRISSILNLNDRPLHFKVKVDGFDIPFTICPSYVMRPFTVGLVACNFDGSPVPPPEGSKRMSGRFGHHPDPAIDFCDEVDSIKGLVYEVRCGMADRKTVEDRIFNAMAFSVGGDAHAIQAKHELRRLEAELASIAPSGGSPVPPVEGSV